VADGNGDVIFAVIFAVIFGSDSCVQLRSTFWFGVRGDSEPWRRGDVHWQGHPV